MKFLLVMMALVGGQAQEYRIPMSPVYVNSIATCETVALQIARDYEATQANFQVVQYACVRG